MIAVVYKTAIRQPSTIRSTASHSPATIMSEPQYRVKLSRPTGGTRVALFVFPLGWADITASVKSFFEIPEGAVVLAYRNARGNVVTLSCQEDLSALLSTSRSKDTGSTDLTFAVGDMRELGEVRPSSGSNQSQYVTSSSNSDGESAAEKIVSPGVQEDTFGSLPHSMTGTPPGFEPPESLPPTHVFPPFSASGGPCQGQPSFLATSIPPPFFGVPPVLHSFAGSSCMASPDAFPFPLPMVAMHPPMLPPYNHHPLPHHPFHVWSGVPCDKPGLQVCVPSLSDNSFAGELNPRQQRSFSRPSCSHETTRTPEGGCDCLVREHQYHRPPHPFHELRHQGRDEMNMWDPRPFYFPHEILRTVSPQGFERV